MTAKEWAEELDRRLDAMGLTIQEDGMAVAEALIQQAVREENEACAEEAEVTDCDCHRCYRGVAERIRGRWRQ